MATATRLKEGALEPSEARDETAGGGLLLASDRMLTASQKLLAGILAISEDAIISVDLEGRIILFNQGAERIFGYTAAEIIGRPLDLLLPEDVRERHAAKVSQFAEGTIDSKTKSERSGIAGRRKDGTVFPAEASISRINTGEETIVTTVLRDVTEKRLVQKQLMEMARYDDLTGLANRPMFRDLLEKAWARIQRSGMPLVLLFMDLDRFKTINDTLGHRIGDLLLKQVAERLTACLRQSDVIARLGGDEFTIVMEGAFGIIADGVASRRSAAIVAKKLVEVIGQPFMLE